MIASRRVKTRAALGAWPERRVHGGHNEVGSSALRAEPSERARTSRQPEERRSGVLNALHKQSCVATRETCSMLCAWQSCPAMFIGVLLLY